MSVSGYTSELADIICQRIAKGESLRKICGDPGMPSSSMIYRWLIAEEEFRQKYIVARDEQADFYVEQCVEISDDGSNDTYEDEDGSKKIAHDHIQRSRLRVDTRKWIAARLAPKKYGDKVTTELTGPDGGAVNVNLIIKLKGGE